MPFQRITSTGSMRSSLKRLARAARDRVRLVLDRLDPADLLGRPAQLAEPAEQRSELLGRPHEQAAELDRMPRRRLDAVEPEQLGGALDLVRHLVDGERERDEVLAVVRCDELRVDRPERLRDDPVALVLELFHLVWLTDEQERAAARPALDQLDEEPRDLARVQGGFVEEVEELALVGRQAARHAALLPPVHTYDTAK